MQAKTTGNKDCSLYFQDKAWKAVTEGGSGMILGNWLHMSSHFNSMLKASNIFLEYITGEYQTKAGEHLDSSCYCWNDYCECYWQLGCLEVKRSPKFRKGKPYILSRHQKTSSGTKIEWYKLLSLLVRGLRDGPISARSVPDSSAVSISQRSNKIWRLKQQLEKLSLEKKYKMLAGRHKMLDQPPRRQQFYQFYNRFLYVR